MDVTEEQKRRFMALVNIRPGMCWLWKGNHSKGYGRFLVQSADQQTIASHRFAYLAFVGKIPEGLELDHLCRNTRCCNPEHVEPVTREENLRRSDVALGIRSAATHCASGHEFTKANTYIRTSGRRACKECNRRRHQSTRGRVRDAEGYLLQRAA